MKLTNKEASEWLIAIKRDYIHGGDEDYDKRRKIALNMGAEALENQKTGHWIIHKLEPNGYDHIKCSVCGQFWSVSGHNKIFKYCFNCGAKME